MKTVIVTNAKNIVNTDIDNDNNNHYNVIKILLLSIIPARILCITSEANKQMYIFSWLGK